MSVKDRARSFKLGKAKTKEAKIKRQEKKHETLRKETNIAKLEKIQREGTYESGIGLHLDGYTEDELNEQEMKITCRRCNRKGHKTANSKKCPFYKARVPTKKKKAAATAAQPPVVAAAASTPATAAIAAVTRRDAEDADRFDSMPFVDDVIDDDEDEFFDAPETVDSDEDEVGII